MGVGLLGSGLRRNDGGRVALMGGLLMAWVFWIAAFAGTTNCVVVMGGPVDGVSFLGSGPVSSTGQALRRNDGGGEYFACTGGVGDGKTIE